MAQIVNIGDKVRFLNDVGGGIVTGFRNGGLVLVEDEDGFEIPVRVQEVVVITPANAAPEPASAPVMVQKEVARPKKEKEEEPTEEDIRIAQLKELYKKEQMSAAPKPVASTAYTPASAASKAPAPATSASVSPATPKVSQEYSDEYVASLEERVLKLELTVKRLQMRLERLEDAKALREKIKSEELERRELQRKKQVDGILEIDLHAHEILDTTAGMSAADIRDYQVGYFKKIMEEHKTEKGKKIVFIHGNGEGVLRNKIIAELKRVYKSCDYQDASFQQYGFGATMVTIH